MPTVKVVDLIAEVQTLLQDSAGTRWSKTLLLGFLNDAQREVALMRPDACVVNAAFTCAASSKQTLPAAGLRLLDVVRNVGGKAIKPLDRDVLDIAMPNWHEYPAAGTTVIEHYVYSPLDPRVFYLFPKPTSAAQIQIVYSAVPTAVESAEPDLSDIPLQTIGVDDTYANAIVQFILYMAYSSDADFSPNVQRAGFHYQQFGQAVGVKTQVDVATAPQAEQVKPS